MSNDRQPSITRTVFECPHCDAYTTQFWYTLHAEYVDKGDKIPNIIRQGDQDEYLANLPEQAIKGMREYLDRAASGNVSLEKASRKYLELDALNLNVSKCFECKKIAVWIHENLIHPPTRTGSPPNQDMPEDIIKDFEEARSILALSPRGAAALLRLCVQKLCQHILGKKSKDLDTDIGTLVAQGLNPLIQKSLDAVRVTGNEAVHPGLLDLNDNSDVAKQLFDLVNKIAEQMITQPTAIEQLYDRVVPESKKEHIRKRDNRDKE